jgi:hypothetical protein
MQASPSDLLLRSSLGPAAAAVAPAGSHCSQPSHQQQVGSRLDPSLLELPGNSDATIRLLKARLGALEAQLQEAVAGAAGANWFAAEGVPIHTDTAWLETAAASLHTPCAAVTALQLSPLLLRGFAHPRMERVYVVTQRLNPLARLSYTSQSAGAIGGTARAAFAAAGEGCLVKEREGAAGAGASKRRHPSMAPWPAFL